MARWRACRRASHPKTQRTRQPPPNRQLRSPRTLKWSASTNSARNSVPRLSRALTPIFRAIDTVHSTDIVGLRGRIFRGKVDRFSAFETSRVHGHGDCPRRMRRWWRWWWRWKRWGWWWKRWGWWRWWNATTTASTRNNLPSAQSAQHGRRSGSGPRGHESQSQFRRGTARRHQVPAHADHHAGEQSGREHRSARLGLHDVADLHQSRFPVRRIGLRRPSA